jgi:probable rRNA maturation factor
MSRRASHEAAPEVSLKRRTRGGWLPSERELRGWVQQALGRRGAGGELGVLLVGPARSRALNALWRGHDRPTNVLSFPASAAARAAGMLGDLVICPAVLRAEAHAQRKSARAHWAHLVVHGALHLVGYDHERLRDARRMERREILVLRRLGLGNPYTWRKRTRVARRDAGARASHAR